MRIPTSGRFALSAAAAITLLAGSCARSLRASPNTRQPHRRPVALESAHLRSRATRPETNRSTSSVTLARAAARKRWINRQDGPQATLRFS